MKNSASSADTLRGLGPKSRQALARVGLDTPEKLREVGAIEAYLLLKQQSRDFKPSLNFLYALVGALEDRDWRDVAKNDKTRLLIELDAASDYALQSKK